MIIVYLDATTVMFDKNVFKNPATYYLQETNDTVNKIEKFLSGESEDLPNIFRVYTVSPVWHFPVYMLMIFLISLFLQNINCREYSAILAKPK